jgi:hypothetical protein
MANNDTTEAAEKCAKDAGAIVKCPSCNEYRATGDEYAGQRRDAARSGRPNLDAPYLPKFKNSVRERQRVRIPMNSLAEGEPFFRFRATSSAVVFIDGVRPEN